MKLGIAILCLVLMTSCRSNVEQRPFGDQQPKVLVTADGIVVDTAEITVAATDTCIRGKRYYYFDVSTNIASIFHDIFIYQDKEDGKVHFITTNRYDNEVALGTLFSFDLTDTCRNEDYPAMYYIGKTSFAHDTLYTFYLLTLASHSLSIGMDVSPLRGIVDIYVVDPGIEYQLKAIPSYQW